MAKEFIVYSATRASFEALVASGEVDNTQIGIIAESGEFWENGNYHPLVMLSDYLKKTDAVALAKDLTGSIEATPEEFTFRTSAGTKSIRDESAVIRRIKGNTSVWGQIAKPHTQLLSDGTTLIALTVDAITWYPLISPQISVIKGHKYLFEINPLNSSYAPENYSLVAGTFRVNIGTPTFYTPTESGEVNWSFRFSPTSNGFLFQIQCFDLTAIFEAGNEPTTIEEFKKTYPESYYPYCEPEVRSMRATGIETIGANAFDKDSVVGGLINADGTVTSNDIYSVAKIEVVPYETYTLTNVANAANTTYTYARYDSEDRFISVGGIKNSVTKPVSVSGDVTMPLNARYIRVVVHNEYLDSCCVNLKHSGTLTSEEATYFKEVRTLPDIAKYFPEGMHGIGDVFDEINEENVVKRFGVVDLGTLTWNVASTGTTDIYRWQSFEFVARPTSSVSEVPNIICVKYKTGSASDTWAKIDCINVSLSGRLFLFDSNYTTAADKDAFVASLQGVLLYYELAEPIVTPVTEPLQLDYKVADFGTEKMLSDLPSSPFRADIVYQFNAADRIRDNARNIERLEEHTKDMATMGYVIEKIPTTVATATERVTTWPSDDRLVANVLVDVSSVSIESAAYSILGFDGGSTDYSFDDVWRVRFAGLSSALNILPTIYWVNGEAPSFDTWAICDIEFRRTPIGSIFGEWKIYR